LLPNGRPTNAEPAVRRSPDAASVVALPIASILDRHFADATGDST
jgi:hypothetical protein